MSPQTAGALPLLAMLAANVVLALGPWMVRLVDVGPMAAGFWRVAIAVPLLAGLCCAIERRPFARAASHWPMLGVAGLAFAADLAAWHLGIHRTTLANATLFGNSATLMFPIYAFLVARAWPTRGQGVALALAAAGGALLLGRSYELSARNLAGDMLCLLSGAAYTVYFILMARARDRMAALPALTLSTVAAILPLLLAALIVGEKVWPDQWGAPLALAIGSQVIGQGLMIYALGLLPPLVVGITLLVQPICAGLIGWVIYGERLGAHDLIGAALVAAALVLVRLAPARTERRAGEEGETS